MLGIWKNFDELEESITISELNAILDAAREQQEREWKFMASIQGVEWGGSEAKEEDPVERAKRRAAAENAGISEDQLDFADLGIEVEYL